MAGVGVYIVQSDIEKIFGVDNIRLWSNVENDDDDADTTIINAQITKSETKIEARFRGGRYAVPFVVTGTNGLEPIKELMARDAGVGIYLTRGSTSSGEEAEEENDRMEKQAKRVEKDLLGYLSSARTLDLEIQDQFGESPQVV